MVNCASIDVFDAWPKSGLLGVAINFLRSELEGFLSDSGVHQVATEMVAAHLEILNESQSSHSISALITPAKFFDLMETFKTHLKHQTANLAATRARYVDGLAVIRATEENITGMQMILERNAPVLLTATAETQQLIETIDQETAEADQERAVVAVEEAQANEIASSARLVKEDCEASLAEAMPAMNAAIAAVSSIDKRQLVEIRSMQNPVDKVKKVLEAVCVLLEVQPKEIRDPHSTRKTYDYWTPARTIIMADVETFRDLLINYDKENMKEEIFEQKIQPYVHDRSFKPEAVANVSKALVGFCNWVIAMEIYYRVHKKVKPKKLHLAAAEEEYARAMAVLQKKKEALQALDDHLASLRAQLELTVAKRDRLQEEQTTTKLKLARAIKMIHGFESEKGRYAEELRRIDAKSLTVNGDSLLASMSVAYLGPFVHEVRVQHQKKWLQRIVENVPISSDFSLETVMSSSLVTLQWKANRLPSDAFSTDSAIMMTTCHRYPFAVDPQSQANIWLKCMNRTHGKDNMLVVQPTAPNFYRIVTLAVQHGHPLLIENCNETLDPFLTPILNKQTTMYGEQRIITIGDNALPPKVTVIGFFVTPSGLKEQSLQHIVQHEHRDLEDKKNRYV